MRASELAKRLIEEIAAHGDLPVVLKFCSNEDTECAALTDDLFFINVDDNNEDTVRFVNGETENNEPEDYMTGESLILVEIFSAKNHYE